VAATATMKIVLKAQVSTLTISSSAFFAFSSFFASLLFCSSLIAACLANLAFSSLFLALSASLFSISYINTSQ